MVEFGATFERKSSEILDDRKFEEWPQGSKEDHDGEEEEEAMMMMMMMMTMMRMTMMMMMMVMMTKT